MREKVVSLQYLLKKYRLFIFSVIIAAFLARFVVFVSENMGEAPKENVSAAAPTDFIYLPTIQYGAALLPGQIIIDESNPAWLFYNKDGDGDGRLDPLFIAGPGDPEGFLYCGSALVGDPCQSDQTAVINKLIGTGANSIYLQAVRSHGGDGDSTHNPFINHNPNKGLDESVLDQWETWFTALDEAGIIIYFFLYDDSACVWNCASNVVPVEERAFIQALVNRFKHHKHWIWVVAEEYAEVYSSQRASNIAAEIRKADDYNHPIALHQNDGISFELPNDPNIDQFAIQYNVAADVLHTGVVTAWEEANGRYNLNMAETSEHGTGATARKNSWAAAMGGAYVMVYQMNVADTAISDLEDLGQMRAFFESTNFYEMEPRDDLTSDWSQTDYVLAKEGDSYIAYGADMTKVRILSMVAGIYDFTWYDIENRALVHENNISIGDGTMTRRKPSGIDGNEVVVYIRHSN